MQGFWEMLTTTLGSAAVISAVSMVFFASGWNRKLRKKNKTLHHIVVAVLFGVLSIYASASAVEVEGALCNCRNLPPLYAGIVGGPIAGLGAALIGGLFRYFVYGGASAVPCMLACFLAGIIGTVIHLAVKKPARYSLPVGLAASVLTEGCHMLLLLAFGLGNVAKLIALPIILANILGIAYSLFIYRHFDTSAAKK